MPDNSYIITNEGCLAQVIGYKHPTNGKFGIINYIPERYLKNKTFQKKWERRISGKVYVKIWKDFLDNWSKNSYDKSMRLISNLFPKYSYKDKFWGHINFFPNNRIRSLIERGKYKSKSDQKLLKALKEIFKLKNGEIELVGGRSFGPSTLNADYDIVVKGLSSSIRVRNNIRKLLKSHSNQYITPSGNPHTRVFLYKNIRIDPSFKYKEGEDPLRNFSYKVAGFKKVKDKVTDDTYSMFIPAIYKLEKNGFLVTYFNKHKMLLKKGDEIEFVGKEIILNSPKFCGNGFLIDLRGQWIKVSNQKIVQK